MTGADFEFTLNDDALMAAVARLEDGLANPLLLFEKIGSYGVRSTQARFLSQTAPDGAAWQAWNPAYAELRGPGSILTRSGALVQSLNFQAGLSEVRWGSPMIYAAVHQFGATIVPKNARTLAFWLSSSSYVGSQLVLARSVTIPARPYLGLSAADTDEIVALAGDYTRDLLTGAYEAF